MRSALRSGASVRPLRPQHRGCASSLGPVSRPPSAARRVSGAPCAEESAHPVLDGARRCLGEDVCIPPGVGSRRVSASGICVPPSPCVSDANAEAAAVRGPPGPSGWPMQQVTTAIRLRIDLPLHCPRLMATRVGERAVRLVGEKHGADRPAPRRRGVEPRGAHMKTSFVWLLLPCAGIAGPGRIVGVLHGFQGCVVHGL